MRERHTVKPAEFYWPWHETTDFDPITCGAWALHLQVLPETDDAVRELLARVLATGCEALVPNAYEGGDSWHEWHEPFDPSKPWHNGRGLALHVALLAATPDMARDTAQEILRRVGSNLTGEEAALTTAAMNDWWIDLWEDNPPDAAAYRVA